MQRALWCAHVYRVVLLDVSFAEGRLCAHYPRLHVLQADFIVPSSREAVDCDSAWNELLREQVPNLFLQALQSFKQLAPPAAERPMAWLNRWLQSIPLPRELSHEH